MKKAKTLIAGIALSAMLLTGCNFNRENNPYTPGNGDTFRQQDIYMLYKAAGGELTYEEWLNTIRGSDGSSLRAGISDPDNSEGNNGDVYVNTSSWEIFLKVGGVWQSMGSIKGEKGDQGEQGPKGDQGDIGPQGPQGPAGNDGKDGQDGKDGLDGQDGASILYGYGRPDDANGRDGDCYVDLNNFDFYAKRDGHWFKVANIRDNLNWNIEVQTEMLSMMGEVLPFADLNEETMYHTYYDYYESLGIGMYIIGDDNDYNVLSDYGDKLIAAGFEYAPGESSYYGAGDYVKVTDEGVELAVSFGYFEASATYNAGNEIVVYMPPYVAPYDEDYFLENGFTKNAGWPEEVIEKAFLEDNWFGPVAEDADWFVRAEEIEGSGANIGKTRTAGWLATEGDVSEEFADALLDAGFIWEDYWEDYELPNDENTYCEIYFQGGYTLVKFVGTWMQGDEPVELPSLTEINDKIVEWFAASDIEITAPEYESSNADAYYQMSGSTIYVYGSNTDDMDAYSAACAANGYTVTYPWASYPHDFKAYFGDKTACLTVEKYSSYVSISLSKVAAPVQASASNINDFIVAYYAALNIELTAPEYPAADASAYYETSGTNQLKVKNSSTADMDAFSAAFSAAGWLVDYPWTSYPHDFKAYFGSNGSSTPCVVVEDYTTYSGYVSIRMTQAEPPVPPTQYSAAEVSAAYIEFFNEGYNIDISNAIVDYPFESENGYFNLKDSFLANGILVYDAYNSNVAEMLSFVSSLEALGWVATYDTTNELYYIEFGETGAVIEVMEQDNGTIRIGGLFVPPPVADFPAADVNAFLAQYQLGFTLSAELVATLPGSSFSFNTGSAGGYAYCYVDIPGNFAAEYEAAISPLLTAAGYTKKTDSSGSEYYANSVDHQVSFKYYANGDYTEVLFFE